MSESSTKVVHVDINERVDRKETRGKKEKKRRKNVPEIEIKRGSAKTHD
jgi:hypothetical protein